jgi:hypothetical protein
MGVAKPPGYVLISSPAGAERGIGAPASDGDGGSGGAKPPGYVVLISSPAGAERGVGAPASDGDGGSGGAKPPGYCSTGANASGLP